jgi:hypothetical protein
MVDSDLKPMFPLKHEFVGSLDRFIDKTLALRSVVEQALRLDLVKEPAKSMLKEHLDALKKAVGS